MEKYIIGIDLGINNVGWSIINEEKIILEKSGVRLFKPSDGAANRRVFRNNKRRMKRKNTRVLDSLKLLNFIGFPEIPTIDSNLLDKRLIGLKNRIDKQDITNVIAYFMSHRGYIPFGDEERELVILANQFPCEYYSNLFKDEGKFRALEKVINHKDLKNELSEILKMQCEFYPELVTIKEPILTCFSRKRQFWEGPGSEVSWTPYGRFSNEKDVQDYHKLKEIGQEKYLFAELIGKCKIKINENCASKGNYYAEEFNLLNDFINISINNITSILDQRDVILNTKTNSYKFSLQAIEKIIQYCQKNTNLTYPKLLKDLFSLKKLDISGYRVDKDNKPQFSTLNTYRYIKGELQKNGLCLEWINDINQYNKIISHITIAPGIVEIKKMINGDRDIQYIFSESEYEILKQIHDKLKSDGVLSYHSLCETILKRANNDMKTTLLNFEQVRRKFDYDKEARQFFIENYNSKQGLLLVSEQYVDEIIASPQVKKSLKQAIKVINAIIEEKGYYPEVISIESTKEMNGENKIKEINHAQKINEKNHIIAKQVLNDAFSEDKITPKNIKKVMLYQEINGMCPYCKKSVDKLDYIINSNLEVEHILPISITSDNSYANLTLSCRECNKSKGNKTPFQWLGKNQFEEFEKHINSLNISNDKKRNFLSTEDIEKNQIKFFHRNLRDTAYATKELVNQINIFNDFLKFNVNDTEIKTLSTPGQLTSRIREEIGYEKIREDGKFHHAVDASIVASIATTNIGKLIIDSQNNRKFWIEQKDRALEAYKDIKNFNLSSFTNQIKEINSDDKVKISMQVIKDPNRSLSNANMYEVIEKDEKYYKIEKISDIYTKDIMKDKKKLDTLFNEKDSKLTLLCQDKDKKLFNFLKNIYINYQSDNSNPFINYCSESNLEEEEQFEFRKNGIRTPSKNGKGVLIQSLRYYSPISDPYFLEKKNINKKEKTMIALDNMSQYCTQIFWDCDKNCFLYLPIFCISVNLTTKKINKKDLNYQYFYNKVIGNKNVRHISNLFNGDYVEVIKSNGNIIKGFVSCYSKSSTSIELKSGFVYTTDKEIISFEKGGKYFSKNDQLIIYNVDYLGNKKIRLTWPEKSDIL